MKANEDKHHLLIIGSEFENLLTIIKIEHKLNFEHHLNSLYKKDSSELQALACISPYLYVYKKKLQMNSFFLFTILLISFCLDFL